MAAVWPRSGRSHGPADRCPHEADCLAGPSLNLAAFGVTGPVAPAVFPLAASAAGLVVAALLVLAVQAVITYQRGSARALRIAD